MKGVNEENFLQEYDIIFNSHFEDCAAVAIRKGKITEEEWKDKTFVKALFFEYSHPLGRHGNKRAKKLGNKIITATLKTLEEKYPSIPKEKWEAVVKKHREGLHSVTEQLATEGYKEKINALIHTLPEKIQKPVTLAHYRTDLRSYFSEEIKKEYYALEKKALEETREKYGTATDTLFPKNHRAFDQELFYELKTDFLNSLKKCDIPNEIKAQITNLLFGLKQEERNGQVEKHYQQILQKVLSQFFQNYFEGREEEILRHTFADHLFYYKSYFKTANTYNPPLTDEELQSLTNYLTDEKKSLPVSLQTIHEICNRGAIEELLAHFPNINISWQLHKPTMAKALDVDFSNMELETLFEKEFHQLGSLVNTTHHIALIDELFKLYKPLPGRELYHCLLGKKKMSDPLKQALRVVFKKIRQQRGLEKKWKPSIPLLAKSAEILFKKGFQEKQKLLFLLASEHLEKELIECFYLKVASHLFPGENPYQELENYEMNKLIIQLEKEEELITLLKKRWKNSKEEKNPFPEWKESIMHLLAYKNTNDSIQEEEFLLIRR